tara:strand:+ start:41 stop:298 length:258 start_codon:yes stop_codon:yes gene_type:complete
MSSNYPDGMTAADHAHLDGVAEECEHENSYCEGWRFVEKSLDWETSKVLNRGCLILEMRCDDCGATSEQDTEIDILLEDVKMKVE